MKPTIAACAALAASAFLGVSGAARADSPAVPGHVVLARTADDALAIWDSTPEMVAIVNAKLSDADAKTRLEHDAVHVLAQVQPKLAATAKTITLRIIYSKTGEVSAQYGTPTFAGVERYATMKVKASDVAADRDKWKELGDAAELPAWMQFDVIGELPPR